MANVKRSSTIKNVGKYVNWKHEGIWVGYFEKYPEYFSQGETILELRDGLLKIYDSVKSGSLSNNK